MVIINIDFKMHVGRKRRSRLPAFTCFNSSPVSLLDGRRFVFHPTHYRELFRTGLDARDVHNMRKAVAFSVPLGNNLLRTD
jgi:hypothetical protein